MKKIEYQLKVQTQENFQLNQFFYHSMEFSGYIASKTTIQQFKYDISLP